MNEWPRPNKDTGIGLHDHANCGWKPNDFQAEVAKFKEHGVSWYLFFVCDEGKADWARCLVDNDIMPILRIWPMSFPKMSFDMAHLLAYRDVGVKWFEVGNEPNLEGEWSGTLPNGRDAARKVAENYARIANTVRAAGMWPLTPALSPGGNIHHRAFFQWFMERIMELGGESVLWPGGIGLHCRPLGNPLEDGPSDYDVGAREWEWYDAIVQGHLGRVLPMCNTEMGDQPDWLPRGAGGNYDWGLWAATNIELWRWYGPLNVGYRYPDHMMADCFWIYRDAGTWDHCGLVDNLAHERQTGQGRETNLWKAMPSIITWTRDDGPIPPPPPDPEPEPQPDSEIEFVGLSAEMIEGLSISGPADPMQPYWAIKRVEVQPKTENMSAFAVYDRVEYAEFFWADRSTLVMAKEDLYAPPGAREWAASMPMFNTWGSYGVKIDGNSESIFGFGLYADNLEPGYTAHHPVLIYFQLVEPTEEEKPMPEYTFLKGMEAHGIKYIDHRADVLKIIADEGMAPDERSKTDPIGSVKGIIVHHSTQYMSIDPSPLGIASYHIKTNGWPGCGYTFIITKDGIVHFMMPIKYVGYHSGDRLVNYASLGICFIGDFTKEEPTVNQLASFLELRAALEELFGGGWDKWRDMWVAPHKWISATECPGQKLEHAILWY